MTFAMRCLAAALMLSPALSLALVWTHTEGLRQRLVEQEEAQARLEADNRRLRSAQTEPGDGSVENLSRRVDEMVAVFGSWMLLRQPAASDGDQTTARVDPMRPDVAVPPSWQQFPPRQVMVAMDPEHALVMTEARAVIAEADRLRSAVIAEADRLRSAYTAAGVPLSWLAPARRNPNTEMDPEARAAIVEADRLRDANTALAELNPFQRASAMWISALAIAGLLGFTVLQHYTARIAFVDAVRTERDQLKTRLKELELQMDGLLHESAKCKGLKQSVMRLARERDQLKTRLKELELQMDGLQLWRQHDD